MTIVSHTLVKNGMPYIKAVLEQAIPYVDRMLITVSVKSSDGTLGVLKELQLSYPKKVFIDTENVSSPGELTRERQKQVDNSVEDWIWFLDDDDYWPSKSIEDMVERINKNEDVDAYSITPYQLIDKDTYDWGWRHKSFTKFFKNVDINYRNPWPRDMIYKGDEILYWKKNPRVPRIPTKFFHLSYLKESSFRGEEWASQFAHSMGSPRELPEDVKEIAEKLCLMR